MKVCTCVSVLVMTACNSKRSQTGNKNHDVNAKKTALCYQQKATTLTRIATLSEHAFRAFPRTRRITVRASGEWTAARNLIGYPLTNRISPHAACSANKHFEFISPNLFIYRLPPWLRRKTPIKSTPYSPPQKIFRQESNWDSQIVT